MVPLAHDRFVVPEDGAAAVFPRIEHEDAAVRELDAVCHRLPKLVLTDPANLRRLLERHADRCSGGAWKSARHVEILPGPSTTSRKNCTVPLYVQSRRFDYL